MSSHCSRGSPSSPHSRRWPCTCAEGSLMFEDVRTGAPLLASHAAALAAALLLAAIHLALGARLRRLLGSGDTTTSVARWPVDLVLGGGVLATLLLLVGVARQLSSAGALIATAVATI